MINEVQKLYQLKFYNFLKKKSSKNYKTLKNHE